MAQGTMVIDTDRCKGCALCTAACPKQLIRMSSRVNRFGYNFAEQISPQQCNGCTACAICCPDGCISVYRIKPTDNTKNL